MKTAKRFQIYLTDKLWKLVKEDSDKYETSIAERIRTILNEYYIK